MYAEICYFLLSLVALVIFCIIFYSDLFIDSVLVHFPELLKNRGEYDGNSPNIGGNLVIISLIVICYATVYLMLMNL